MNIFLCGGFKSGWQDHVRAEIQDMRPSVEIYDPREHLMHDPGAYTERDLGAIVECDIVFALIERSWKDNQRYLDQCFQIGFAIALGKKVILINQHGAHLAQEMHQMCDCHGDVDGALTAMRFMEEFLQ